jgi:hypothetical protein
VRGEGGEQAEGDEAADEDGSTLALAQFSYHLPAIGIWSLNLDPWARSRLQVGPDKWTTGSFQSPRFANWD